MFTIIRILMYAEFVVRDGGVIILEATWWARLSGDLRLIRDWFWVQVILGLCFDAASTASGSLTSVRFLLKDLDFLFWRTLISYWRILISYFEESWFPILKNLDFLLKNVEI